MAFYSKYKVVGRSNLCAIQKPTAVNHSDLRGSMIPLSFTYKYKCDNCLLTLPEY